VGKKVVKRRTAQSAGTKRRTRKASPSRPTWDGPDRVWWGPRIGPVVSRKGAALPAVDMLARSATGERRRVVEPSASPRIALRDHPAYRARWQELRAAVASAGLTRAPGPHLDQTADFFLVVEVGRAAMIRAAKMGDPAFTVAEADAAQKVLTKASARLRQVASRLNAARKHGQPRERLEELEQQGLAALRERFVAHITHEAAVGRFNATWTEADHPSTRQLTDEKRSPLIALGRPLIGELGYTVGDAARLLAAAGYIAASSQAPSGEKSPAQGLLETALLRDHRTFRKPPRR
jgi:hypothetical protein